MKPLEDNILEFHFCVEGPPNAPYQGAYYHGKLIFLANYPMNAPQVEILTPNGRFATGMSLCITIRSVETGEYPT